MGCVIRIPKRESGLRQLEEGASLLERRRKFQSLIGLGIWQGTKALVSRPASVAEMKTKILAGSSGPDLVKLCYGCRGWCQSSSAATEIRSGRYVTLLATSIRHIRHFSHLGSSTANRKTIMRFDRWLLTINLPFSTWMPMHPSAIPRMPSRLFNLRSLQCRSSSSCLYLTSCLNYLDYSSARKLSKQINSNGSRRSAQRLPHRVC